MAITLSACYGGPPVQENRARSQPAPSTSSSSDKPDR
jgi:hypothetical protein